MVLSNFNTRRESAFSDTDISLFTNSHEFQLVVSQLQFPINTRSQAVDSIVDHSASQQTLLISNCCGIAYNSAYETPAVTLTCSVVDCHITPLFKLKSH